MDFQELLINRRSCRRYKEVPVETEKIDLLLKAALMSPSSKRTNPWEFIVITDKNKLQELSACKEHGAVFLADAPMAIVVVADTQKSDVWVEDTSVASIIIQLQAETLGLGSCWIQVRKRNKADGTHAEDTVREILDIPNHIAVESIIAVGYKNSESKPFDSNRLQKEKLHINNFSTEYKIQ